MTSMTPTDDTFFLRKCPFSQSGGPGKWPQRGCCSAAYWLADGATPFPTAALAPPLSSSL